VPGSYGSFSTPAAWDSSPVLFQLDTTLAFHPHDLGETARNPCGLPAGQNPW
jgi:hypothetical protein